MKTILVSLIMSLLAPLGCGPTQTQSTPPNPPAAETWAFVGVHPDDPYAQRKANTMARVAGIDATFGPALAPDWATYSPAFPGQRYLDPNGYLRVLKINAKAGMKTVVYDARVWSDEPHIRQEAIDFWTPHLSNIRAWDMGDEYDPESADWGILVHRWQIVETKVTPLTGVGPFTNNFGWNHVTDAALRDMPSQANHYSFDMYTEDETGYPVGLVEAARYARDKVNHLMCAVNALDHLHYKTSGPKLEDHIRIGKAEGCKTFLIFGGDTPWETPGFETPSLVTPTGDPTALAYAVKNGA